MTQGPWQITDTDHTNEVAAHDVVWTVLTDDNNEFGAYCLRVADHGQDVMDSDVVKILLSPDMAEALIEQFTDEARPYAQGLAQ